MIERCKGWACEFFRQEKEEIAPGEFEEHGWCSLNELWIEEGGICLEY